MTPDSPREAVPLLVALPIDLAANRPTSGRPAETVGTALDLAQCPYDLDPGLLTEIAERYPKVAAIQVSESRPEQAWAIFDAFPEVVEVRLSVGSLGPEPSPQTPADWLDPIAGRSRWESLTLSFYGRSADDLAWLAGYPRLTMLNLQNAPVRSDALTRLTACRGLDRLVLGAIVGDDAATPQDASFLRTGTRWRWLVAEGLRLAGDDLAYLASLGTVEELVVDARQIDEGSLPAIEALLTDRAVIRLCRANLGFEAVERLRRLAASRGGSFDVVTDGADRALRTWGQPWPTPP